MRTNSFGTNFLNTPRGPGHPGKIPGTSQIPPFETQGRQTVEGGRELFGHHHNPSLTQPTLTFKEQVWQGEHQYDVWIFTVSDLACMVCLIVEGAWQHPDACCMLEVGI